MSIRIQHENNKTVGVDNLFGETQNEEVSIKRSDDYYTNGNYQAQNNHVSDSEDEPVSREQFDFVANKDRFRQQPESESESEEDLSEDESENETLQPVPLTEHVNLSEGYIRKEKAYALFQLKKLVEKGYNATSDFTMDNELNEIKDEVSRIKKEVEIEKAVRLSRQGLTLISSLIEFGNTKYDPLGIELNGWSESVNANIDDYDEVFEELYEKYHTSVSVSPEIKLLLMITGSAISFHVTKKMLGGGASSADIMNTVTSSITGNKPAGNMKGPSGDIEGILARMNSNRKNGDDTVSSNSSMSDDEGIKVDMPKRQRKKTVLAL